jgi:TatD DNase family protein
MLKRCSQVNVNCVMSTSTSAEDYHENSDIIKEFSEKEGNPKILTTLGVHPSYCENVFKKCGKDYKKVDEYFEKMRKIFEEEPKNLIAIGECGLDYARLFRSPKETQIEFFQRHFDLLAGLEASKRPPMFLHTRDCSKEFIEILRKNKSVFPGGVVHSFTGSVEEAKELLEFSDDLFIGFNGCSLREELGIQVAAMVPLDRIMIESDAPYCEMRPSYASRPFLTDFTWSIPKAFDKEKHSIDNPVRGRNEPTETRRVLRVLSKIKGIDEEELAEIIYKNTLKLFPKCEI